MQKERFIMKKLGEEVAYLKGLAEGLDIDDKSKEGKMISKIVEILGSFADTVEELEYSVEDLEDQVEELQYEVEELQQDVEDLEEWLYDEDEDYDDEDDYDEYDDEEEDDVELSFIEMECPNCSEIVEIDENEEIAKQFIREYVGDSFYNFHFCDVQKSFNVQSK